MSFTVVGKRFYFAGDWATVNLRSNELNSNISVGFRLETKAEEPLERRAERRAREVLQAAIRALEPSAAPEDDVAEDGGTVTRRLAAE
jgi:hypothetical protein